MSVNTVQTTSPAINESSAPLTRRQPSRFFRAIHFITEPILKNMVYIILGIAAQILFPSIAAAFFAIAASSILTRLVVKLINWYDSSRLDDLKEKVDKLTNKYPILIVSLVVAIVVCPFFQIGGIIVGVFFGILNGILMGVELNRTQSALPSAPTEPTEKENAAKASIP